MERLDGKRILITGGASGMGRVTVENFPSLGAKVAFFDVNEKDGEEVAKQSGTIATIKIVDTHLDGSFPSCLCPKNLKAIKASCVFGASAAEKAPRPAVCRQF